MNQGKTKDPPHYRPDYPIAYHRMPGNQDAKTKNKCIFKYVYWRKYRERGTAITLKYTERAQPRHCRPSEADTTQEQRGRHAAWIFPCLRANTADTSFPTCLPLRARTRGQTINLTTAHQKSRCSEVHQTLGKRPFLKTLDGAWHAYDEIDPPPPTLHLTTRIDPVPTNGSKQSLPLPASAMLAMTSASSLSMDVGPR